MKGSKSDINNSRKAFDSITKPTGVWSMSDIQRVKQLLDGKIELDELEMDTELYEMAESI